MPRTTGPDSEAQLADSMRHGDPRAFETLLRTYGPRLLSTARRILMNDEDAREAVQEAFINAYRARERFHGEARLSTWLHRITVNAALTKLRTRRRRSEESIEDLLPRFLPTGQHTEVFQSWQEPADVTLERKETAEAVRRAIGRLPETYRTVLMLRDIEGMTNQEVAEILEITPNAVKIRLHRARMALRTLIAPQFGGAIA
jgi:RNA polymerase sigma-70 factor (ECF subfamily)